MKTQDSGVFHITSNTSIDRKSRLAKAVLVSLRPVGED
jgi:hypothetical protein